MCCNWPASITVTPGMTLCAGICVGCCPNAITSVLYMSYVLSAGSPSLGGPNPIPLTWVSLPLAQAVTWKSDCLPIAYPGQTGYTSFGLVCNGTWNVYTTVQTWTLSGSCDPLQLTATTVDSQCGPNADCSGTVIPGCDVAFDSILITE